MEPRKTAARILPDSRTFAGVVSISVGVIFLAACMVSFSGQAEVAESYLGLSGWTKYLIPVVVDVSLLVYAAAALVRRARGESVRGVVIASGFWVVVSVAANVVHVIQPQHIYVGAVLAALMPIAILMSSTVAETLLVAPPAVGHKLDREAALAAELDAERAENMATVESHIQENDALKALVAKLEVAAKVASAAAQPAGAEVKGKPVAKALASVPDLPAASEDRDTRIVELRAGGMSQPDIARKLATSVSTIKRVLAANKTAAA